MGTESENKYTVYLDGMPIDPEKIVNFTVTAEAEPNSPIAGQSSEITMHFKAPKHWRWDLSRILGRIGRGGKEGEQ